MRARCAPQDGASLVLADGMPLVWASRSLGRLVEEWWRNKFKSEPQWKKTGAS